MYNFCFRLNLLENFNVVVGWVRYGKGLALRAWGGHAPHSGRPGKSLWTNPVLFKGLRGWP